MNRLKELRESLGLGPDKFASIFGIHRSSVYRYEGTNKSEPRDIPMDLAIRIAEKFNVSLDWLVGNDNTSKYRDQSLNNLVAIYNNLSEQNKIDLLDYANYLKSKQEVKCGD